MRDVMEERLMKGLGSRVMGRRLLGVFSCAFLALILASCVRTITRAPGLGSPDQQTVFKKLEGCKLSLECLSPERTFYSGQTATLIFALKNMGSKAITIFEWKANERNNLVIHYAPAEKGQTRPPEKGWKEQRAKPEQTPRRAALDLAPGNHAPIDIELDFVRDASLPTANAQDFWVFASLDLTSLSCESPSMRVTVRP